MKPSLLKTIKVNTVDIFLTEIKYLKSFFANVEYASTLVEEFVSSRSLFYCTVEDKLILTFKETKNKSYIKVPFDRKKMIKFLETNQKSKVDIRKELVFQIKKVSS